jgi:hypothetical protein
MPRGKKTYGRKPKGVRWGKMREIDKRIHVGTGAWEGMPRRLKHLTSWRRMHMLPGGKAAHMPVRMYGTRAKVRPSSNLRLKGYKNKGRSGPSKLGYIQRKGGF